MSMASHDLEYRIRELAEHLFQAENSYDPNEQSVWESLTPYEKRFYQYCVRKLLQTGIINITLEEKK
jgi:hypothetical protein